MTRSFNEFQNGRQSKDILAKEATNFMTYALIAESNEVS